MIYTIRNEFLSLSVDSEGGSMSSIIYLPTGEERLWQGEEFWKSRDVVIFPIIGHAGAYEAQGRVFTPKSHGLARYASFEVADRSPDGITLKFGDSEETKKTYPYGFEFFVTYKLYMKTITVSYFIRAKEGKIPYYVGGHPGMRAPGGEAVIEFECSESPVMYPIDSAEAVRLESLNRFVANKPFFAECKTFQLGSLSGGAIYAYTRDGYRYTYQTSSPVVAFWSNPEGGDYVCVEPWWGINDFPASPREITLKPFMNFADTQGEGCSYSLTIEKI